MSFLGGEGPIQSSEESRHASSKNSSKPAFSPDSWWEEEAKDGRSKAARLLLAASHHISSSSVKALESLLLFDAWVGLVDDGLKPQREALALLSVASSRSWSRSVSWGAGVREDLTEPRFPPLLFFLLALPGTRMIVEISVFLQFSKFESH